jgi:hypothetical protein
MAFTRISAVGLAVLLVASAITAAISMNTGGTAFAQEDRLWYVGEGAKQDMWVRYRLQEFDTNNGRPFEMVIHFKEQQDGDWIAPVAVIDQGKVIKGTLKLGSNLAPISAGADVPAELNNYIGAYRGSLQWLESFSPQSQPKSLDQPSWGKLACIGCEEIKPLRQEKITVAGGTFDTTVVGWHKSTDSDIWIANNFPYPIKAQTYADVTQGQAPTLFAFELLATGMGEPDIPESEIRAITPPLSKTTARGTYDIQIDWEPAEIQPGATVVFGVTMTERGGFPLERVSYDFTVKDAQGNVIKEFKNQNAELGTGTHEVTFGDAGPATVSVTLIAISGNPVGGGTFTEAADFNIAVVPEFPLGAAIVAAAIIGTLVFLTRSRMSGIGSLFGRRDAL